MIESQTKLMFTIHTIESAPEGSRTLLQGLSNKFGFIPNVAATMAGSPVLINAFMGVFSSFHGADFSDAEKQVLLLTNAVVLQCPWTVAFHSTMALQAGLSETDVKAIRTRSFPRESRYAALSALTRALIENRGMAAQDEVHKFISAGYSQAQMLQIIAGIGASTMAATMGNLAGTPVEDRFEHQSWTAA